MKGGEFPSSKTFRGASQSIHPDLKKVLSARSLGKIKTKKEIATVGKRRKTRRMGFGRKDGKYAQSEKSGKLLLLKKIQPLARTMKTRIFQDCSNTVVEKYHEIRVAFRTIQYFSILKTSSIVISLQNEMESRTRTCTLGLKKPKKTESLTFSRWASRLGRYAL
jgi:hypothetical protein